MCGAGTLYVQIIRPNRGNFTLYFLKSIQVDRLEPMSAYSAKIQNKKNTELK